MARGRGVTLWKAPPLLPLIHRSSRMMVPGRGALQEAGEVLARAIGVTVAGAAALSLGGRNDLDRGEINGVCNGGLSRGGKRQLMVMMVMVGVGAQGRLHMSRKLNLSYREGHLMGSEARARCYFVAPELKHAGCGAYCHLTGEPGPLCPRTVAEWPGLAARGGQKGQAVGASVRGRAGGAVLLTGEG